MNYWKSCGLLLYVFSALNLHANILGTASSFAVLGGSMVTNTGNSIVSGNLGVSPGLPMAGFPWGTSVTNGSIHIADAAAATAHDDAVAAYVSLAGFAFTHDLTGQDLGGLTLTPGVYRFSSAAQLTGQLILDAQQDPNALFIFQIGSTLTTASNSSVLMVNDANCCNVYWQTGSSATLGTYTEFKGNLLASASITLNTGAHINDGSALALTGAVTLDNNTISIPGGDTIITTTGAEVPEPGSLLLLGIGLFGLILLRRAYSRRAAYAYCHTQRSP